MRRAGVDKVFDRAGSIDAAGGGLSRPRGAAYARDRGNHREAELAVMKPTAVLTTSAAALSWTRTR